jgi:transposase
MSQKRAYKSYTKEFKEEAVALIIDQGYRVPEAVSALGVSVNLYSTSGSKNFDGQSSGKALSDDERDELKKLRAENKRLRMAKEILKRLLLSSLGK